jgi:hypothetical protein
MDDNETLGMERIGFKINSKEEADKFEELLLKLHDDKFDFPGKILFGLGEIFEVCQKFKPRYGGRVFTSILDIAITHSNCVNELYDCFTTWNKYFAQGNLYGITTDSIFTHDKFLEGRFFYHRHLLSFIFTFRALWDKIMGLHFLVFNLSEYDSFIKSHEKKKKFLKNFENHKLVDAAIIKYVKEDLQSFDDSYRTQEAHNTGVLRKYTFWEGGLTDSNLAEDIVNFKYSNYAKIAPKIFDCINYFKIFPEAISRIENEKSQRANPNDAMKTERTSE